MDFCQAAAQNAVNPFGFTSILTIDWRKSVFKKLFRIILANLQSTQSAEYQKAEKI
jgi:hypothetical protein